ncbi:MAG: cytochrome c-type biogenesis protein [Thiotrichales bacterium]
MTARLTVALLGLLLTLPCGARQAQPLADDPALERRLEMLAEELRCVVCQNETLAGSRTEIARDLKREIRELMEQGRTDAEVLAYLTERYGDFVLYRPPLKASTWVLWFGPLIFLGSAAIAWAAATRRYRPRAETGRLTPGQRSKPI